MNLSVKELERVCAYARRLSRQSHPRVIISFDVFTPKGSRPFEILHEWKGKLA